MWAGTRRRHCCTARPFSALLVAQASAPHPPAPSTSTIRTRPPPRRPPPPPRRRPSLHRPTTDLRYRFCSRWSRTLTISSPSRRPRGNTSRGSRYVDCLLFLHSLVCIWLASSSPRTPRSRKPRAASQGPLVGKKTPSTAITEEYAKADPVYVQKTLVRHRDIITNPNKMK